MMGRASQLIFNRFSAVERAEVRKSYARIKRGTGKSGEDVFEDEPERIESYIKQKYLDRIVDMASSRDAVVSLKDDSVKAPLGNDDFDNLLRGAGYFGRESFAEYLFNKYGKPRLKEVEKTIITLRSGRERKGIMFDKNIYLISIKTRTGKKYIQARDFKTGRVVALEKNIRTRFSDIL